MEGTARITRIFREVVSILEPNRTYRKFQTESNARCKFDVSRPDLGIKPVKRTRVEKRDPLEGPGDRADVFGIRMPAGLTARRVSIHLRPEFALRETPARCARHR